MHVAVLGAGYAGVTLIRRLERSLPEAVELTLVDERETHLVQHLLHRAVRKPDIADHLTVSLSACCDRATIRQETVETVDADSGLVEFADGTLEYDVGVMCLGAQTAYYDLPGLTANATPLKRLQHAHTIRDDFLQMSETGGQVVVGGAGLSGIQVAGELAELARTDETESDVDIVLLEQKSSVAPEFPRPFQEAVRTELQSRDVHVRTETTVTAAEPETVVVSDGETIPCDQLIWTGGITGPLAMSGAREQVRSTLRLGQRTFGVGDAVTVIDNEGTKVPASAQTAIRQARVAATNVEKLVTHESSGDGFEPRLSRYVYDSPGWVVTVGDGTVAQVGSRVVRGTPAKALKTTIGVQHLVGVGAVEDAIEYAQGSLTRKS